jgi:hypothetical protein
MTMPDRIQITHQPRTMTTPTIRTAMTSDDIPPGPLSEDDLRQRWNQQTDEHNQWESLDSCEQLAWAQALAIKADRHAAALKAKPEEQRPSETDLYDLAAEFNGDPVPAMRRALEVWGNPLQGASAPGENPATPPAPEQGEVEEVAQWLLSMRELAGEHNPEERRQFTRAAGLLQRLAPPAYLVVGRPPEGFLDLLKSEPGRIEACTAGVSFEPLGEAARPTYLDAIRLAQGCHDYSGGHSGTEGEAWHGAISTVVDVLKRAAAGPWDSQIRAVYGVGVEAGDVAVPVPVAVSERPWEREGWRDEQGRCWFCNAYSMGRWSYDTPPDPGQGWGRLGTLTHSLPHWAIQRPRAIPKPAPHVGEGEA